MFLRMIVDLSLLPLYIKWHKFKNILPSYVMDYFIIYKNHSISVILEVNFSCY